MMKNQNEKVEPPAGARRAFKLPRCLQIARNMKRMKRNAEGKVIFRKSLVEEIKIQKHVQQVDAAPVSPKKVLSVVRLEAGLEQRESVSTCKSSRSKKWIEPCDVDSGRSTIVGGWSDDDSDLDLRPSRGSHSSVASIRYDEMGRIQHLSPRTTRRSRLRKKRSSWSTASIAHSVRSRSSAATNYSSKTQLSAMSGLSNGSNRSVIPDPPKSRLIWIIIGITFLSMLVMIGVCALIFLIKDLMREEAEFVEVVHSKEYNLICGYRINATRLINVGWEKIGKQRSSVFSGTGAKFYADTISTGPGAASS